MSSSNNNSNPFHGLSKSEKINKKQYILKKKKDKKRKPKNNETIQGIQFILIKFIYIYIQLLIFSTLFLKATKESKRRI